MSFDLASPGCRPAIDILVTNGVGVTESKGT